MKVRLADMVTIVLSGNTMYLDTGQELYEIENTHKKVFDILKMLKDGCSYSKFTHIIKVNDMEDLLAFLAEEKLLRYNEVPQSDVFFTQLLYFDDFSENCVDIQQQINCVKIAIIGIGGVGTVVLQHLVAAGFRDFVLIDYDTVSLGNITRQFIYRNEELKRYKVDCAKQYIMERNNSATVAVIKKKIEVLDDLNILDSFSLDFIINAADTPSHLPNMLNQYCMKRSIPFSGSEVSRNGGFWGPLIIPKQTLCYECFQKKYYQSLSKIGQELSAHFELSHPLQACFAPVNTIISTFFVKDIILYLGGVDEQYIPSINSRIFFNFKENVFSTFSGKESPLNDE